VFAAVLNSYLLRVVPIGMTLLAIQKTLFVELRPFGVIVQLVLAFACAAAAAGGPEKGAIAAFTLGLMFDLSTGSPLGSSSIAFGVAAYLAGWVDVIRIETTWWLAAVFVGLGSAVGEALAPVVRRFVGEEDAFNPNLATIIPVVAVSAAILSVPLVPVGRWALKVPKPEWKVPEAAVVKG
jgi:rod shape-determining protein MreD